MINAPQAIIDKLESNNFSQANLVTINLGDAYGLGDDVILYLTDYGHELSYGGNLYTPDHNLSEIEGISRKASTGSDEIEISFDVTDAGLIDVIRSERYINKPTSIQRVIVVNGAVYLNFAIPVRTAWGLSHSITGTGEDRRVTLTIDSTLGDLDGDNGWYAIDASHQKRHPNDRIMRHGATVMTEEQQKKYTTNFKGVINQEIKPPSLSKVYGYKNVELVPICMLKHRKSHTSYRHYFTTLIYVINIGDCDYIDINNLMKDDERFDGKIVNNNDRDVGGWSARVRTPAHADAGDLLSYENNNALSFWFEGMDSAEKSRFTGMRGKGLTLLFVKNRNRDDWLTTPPKFTVPVRGSRVYDPRSGSTVFSRNPALQYADFLRSTEYGAGGRGVTVSDSNIIELANHFDQIPDSIGNDGINSILIDVQLDTGDPIVDNMNIWMEGVRLFTSDYYGEFRLRVETSSAVVWSINESDLLEEPDYDSGAFTDRINQLTYTVKQLVKDQTAGASANALVEINVEATFPPDGSQIYNDWLAEDGGIVNFESEQLNYVTSLEQAYYWAMVDSRISRQPRTLTIKVGAKGWLIEVGDVIEFTSDILDMADTLWRVDEVSEDEGAVELSCIAYDANFYTPDPNAIPDPVGLAQPPTGVSLAPPTGIQIIESGGLYYIDWFNDPNQNILWYAVILRKDELIFLDNPKVSAPPLVLPDLVVGDYEAEITAIGKSNESESSLYTFTIALPEVPTINTTVGNFTIEVYPSVTKRYLGSTFRLRINDNADFNTSVDKGTAGAFTISVNPNTQYWLWVRTENIIGESDWATVSVTTLNDNTVMLDFLGLDTETIIEDVLTGLQGDLDELIDLTDQQNITDLINAIWENHNSEESTIEEGIARKTQFELLEVNLNANYATKTYALQLVADESSARATEINQLSVSVANNYATISSLNLVSADVLGNTQAVSALQGQVGNGTTGLTATYNLAFGAKTTADGAASSIAGIRTAVAGSDNQTQTELILSSTVDIAGQVEGKAVLGVSSGGVFTGMAVINGASYNGIEFRADVFKLSDSAGVAQLYWSASQNQWLFNGSGKFSGRLEATSSDGFAVIRATKTSAGGQTAFFDHTGGGGGNAITAESSGNTIQSTTTNASGAALVASNTQSSGDAIRILSGEINMQSKSFSLAGGGTTGKLSVILNDIISRIEALEP